MGTPVELNLARMYKEYLNMCHAYHRMMSYNQKIDLDIDKTTPEQREELKELRTKIKHYIGLFDRSMHREGGDFDSL